MALESLGDMAKTIDRAFQLCHDLLYVEMQGTLIAPEQVAANVANQFMAGEKDAWSVKPCLLGGRPAVEIRIAVG